MATATMATAGAAAAGKPVKTNKVLVVGPKGVGKRFVLQKIVGVNELLLVDSPVTLVSGGASGGDAKQASVVQYVRWTVDNKYYTAWLDLHVVDSGVADPSTTAHAMALGQDCQAVVLVFDATDRAAYAALTDAWLPFVRKFNPPILMLIGNERPAVATPSAATGAAPTATDAKSRERSAAERAAIERLGADAFDWGVDHGVEFIAVHPHNDNSKIKPHPAHFGPPEKYGTDRIAESLQANLWTHLTRKPLHTSSFGGAGGRVKKGESLLASQKIAHNSKTVVDVSSKVTSTTTTTTGPKGNGSASGAASSSSSSSSASSSASASSTSSSANAGSASSGGAAPGATAKPSSSSSSSSSSSAALGVPKGADAAAALERDMANFEQLFEQMKVVRDRNAADPTLTDSDRRAAAERAAMALARSLGLDDDDDDLAAMQAEMRAMAGPPRAGGAAGGGRGGAGGMSGAMAALMARGDIDVDHFDDDDAADDDDPFGGPTDGAMPLAGGDDDDDELVVPSTSGSASASASASTANGGNSSVAAAAAKPAAVVCAGSSATSGAAAKS